MLFLTLTLNPNPIRLVQFYECNVLSNVYLKYNRYSNYRNYRGHSKRDHASRRGALGGVYVRRM